jgi:TolB-like protein/DNA-binding SARP family transcriptional activator/Tfp pilus assembly protein PilF
MKNRRSRAPEEAGTTWRLCLLGPMTLHRGADEAALPGRKAQALLAYLARRPDVDIPREVLCGLLWGERAEEQARASLRQALTALRRAFGADVDRLLKVSNATLRLQSDGLSLDTQRFERLAASGNPQEQAEAVDLFKGDFLEGFPAADPEFDRWLASERAALRTALLRCLTALLDHSEAERRSEQVVAFATQLLRHDPLQEHVHRALMRAYAAQGRFDAALKQLEDLTSILEQDLGIRPEPATLELARDIRRRRESGAGGRQHSNTHSGQNDGKEQPAPALPKRPSIAVMPFRSLSSDEEASYFGEGIAEDIIIELSRSSELFVVARQSSFRFGSEEELNQEEIGRELGVRFCLSGSVRRSGKRLRVSAHLTSCEGEQEIWADRYDRELEDVFDIQTEIARTVTATVVGRITSADAAERLLRPGNLAAYDLVLQGLQHLHRYTREDIEAACSHFAEAVSQDDSYGRAYGLLAIANIYADWYYGLVTDFSEAGALAEKAVQLDPRDTKAHCALGMTRLIAGDHSRAGIHFETALGLNPNDDLLLVEYGRYLMYVERSEEGLLKIREAMRLNPYHPNWYWNLYGRCLHTLGRHEEAVETFEKVVNPPFWTLAYLAACHAALGNKELAAQFREQTYEAKPDFTWESFARIFPYQNPATAERYFETFRAAGIG